MLNFPAFASGNIIMPPSRTIPFDKLVEPQAPVRFAMDEGKLAELVESIRAKGLLQPIGVFPRGDLFEITYGHRRYKACQILGLKEVECIVFEGEAKARYAAMLDENLCREDITAAEEAIKYQEIVKELDCTEEELFKIVNRPASYVYARIDLLNGHRAVLEAVGDRKINLSIAQQLNRIDDAAHALYLLNQAIEGGATARVVAAWVVDYKRNGPGQIIDLAPIKEQGAQGAAASDAPKCAFCGQSNYPANHKWIMVHDFELEQILAQIHGAAQVPATEESESASASL